MSNAIPDDERRTIKKPVNARMEAMCFYLRVHFKYFYTALDTLYSDVPYGNSLYQYIADKEGTNYSTVASTLRRVPDRAKKYDPDLYERITGTTNAVMPLFFLRKCAYWLRNQPPMPES